MRDPLSGDNLQCFALVMESYQLVAAQGEFCISLPFVITKLHFVDLWCEDLNYGANLTAFKLAF